MICTFGDTHRRHLVAGTAAAGAADHRLGRPHPGRRAAVDHHRLGPGGIPLAARADRLQRPAAHGGVTARHRQPARRTGRHHPPGQVLREGRQAAGDRDHPPVVPAQRRPRPGLAGGPSGTWLTTALASPTCRCARQLGSGLNGDWLISRQRFFGVPFPSGIRWTTRAARTTTNPSWRPSCPSTRPPTAARLPRTSAKPARRFHGRPGCHGHVGDFVAHPADRRRLGHRPPICGSASRRWICARRRTRSSAPGCSPRWCAPTWRMIDCRGAMRPSAAGSSTRTARRCPSQGQCRDPDGTVGATRL